MDITIAHVSDPHVGELNFIPEKLESCIKEVNELKPDVVVLTGDLTMFAFRDEYKLLRQYLAKFEPEIFVIPGNHDARYRGDIYFQRYFGHGDKVMKMQDLTIVGIDSSVPDLDEGTVGRRTQKWLERNLKKIPEGKCKVVAIHHHIIPIPRTGRERSVLTDAGDVLKILVKNGVDLVLCGHRHTPFSWLVNNVAIVTAGSPSTEKVRADIPQSYNVIRITNKKIDIRKKVVDGQEMEMACYRRVKGEEYKICHE